jgi:hypothetical protein
MKENATQEEGLLVRVEPLDRAEEITQRMVDVKRLEDGVLWLDAKPEWAWAIYAVMVEKGVCVKEIRKQTTPAARLIA